MKIERLRNGRYKLVFLCGFILVVTLLILSIIFKGSKAKYRNTQVIPFVKGYITAKKSDFTTMGIYLEDANGTIEKNNKKYTEQGENVTIPSDGYVINEANSYCEKYDASQDKSVVDTNAKFFTNQLRQHVLSGISKGDKCYIYLDEYNIKNFLLKQWRINEADITTRTDFTKTVEGRDTTNNRDYVYKAEDDDGISYYLAGQPENNWVKFANLYWRIVRINGNGSLRLIYQGIEPNITTGTNLETTTYNSNYASAEYVGYMWTVGQQRGYSSSSKIKGRIDNFYNTKLASFASYIDKEAGFCNDRTVIVNSANGYTGTAGAGTLRTLFASRNRLLINKAPVLNCTSNDDLFTVNGATKGNGKLTYPIGLITADEVAMGGLVFATGPSSRNVNMYDTGEHYWSMSPGDFNENYAVVLFVKSDGSINGDWNGVTRSFGVRPVINLIKDITFSKGDGTSTYPFEI